MHLQSAIRDRHDFDEIVGHSTVFQFALSRLERVAPTNSNVLLRGPTGSGKELFARALHERSRRYARPFVRVNCAALPATLIESELFGHEKGAFTGAVATRQGRFEAAGGGTIFLDEIGDLPSDIQVKFLRVLQEREFERVGSSQHQHRGRSRHCRDSPRSRGGRRRGYLPRRSLLPLKCVSDPPAVPGGPIRRHSTSGMVFHPTSPA